MAKTTNVGNGETNTYIIDPNPIGTEAQKLENLVMYANLRAFPKSRSVILGDGDVSSFSEAIDISFIGKPQAPYNENTHEYATTDFTKLGNTTQTYEGFGITSISIDSGANLVPSVNIKFVDARGGAIFNNYEYSDDVAKYTKSNFDVFFKQPYPLFELTVKGYYGKPVTYCLHMTTWNAKFNSKAGAFEIDANFIGFQFAFLSDINLRNVMALTATSQGQSYLDNTPTLDSFLSSLGQLTRIAEEFKAKESDYQELIVINTLQTILNEIQGYVGKPLPKTSSDYISSTIKADIRPSSEQISVYDLLLVNSSKSLAVNNFNSNLNDVVANYTDLLEKNKSNYGYINDFQLSLDSKIKEPFKFNDAIDYIRQIISSKNIDVSSIEIITIYRRLGYTELPINDWLVYDIYNFKNNVNTLLDKIVKKQNELQKILTDKLNKQLKKDLGFDLSVEIIFTILLNNVESFLKIIYDTSVSAETKNADRLAQLNYVKTDINERSKTIYPFPSCYDNDGNELFLGDVVTNPDAFPELDLVYKTIDSIVASASENAIEKQIINSQNSQGTNLSWFPINPLDYTNNDLATINTMQINGINWIIPIVKRFLVSQEYSGYTGDKLISAISKFESAYLNDVLTNDTLKYLIANYELNIDDVVDVCVNSDLMDTEYKLLDYNFANTNISPNQIHISTVEPKNNLTLSPSVASTLLESNNISDLFNNGFHGFIQNDLSLKYDLTDSDYVWNNSVTKSLINIYNQKNPQNLWSHNKPNVTSPLNYVSDLSTFISSFSVSEITNIITNIGDIDYNDNDKYHRAYTWLTSLPISFYSLEQLSILRTSIVDIPKCFLLLIGASFKFDPTWIGLLNDSFKSQLISYFENWVDNNYIGTTGQGVISIEDNSKTFREFISIIQPSSTDKLEFYKASQQLCLFLTEIVSLTVYSDNFIFSNDYNVNVTKQTLQNYLSQFFQNFKKFANNVATNIENNEINLRDSYVKDKDLKLAIYKNYQSIYNKWIAGSPNHRIFNLCGCRNKNFKQKSLLDYFHFVDKNWSDIGSKAVLNPKPLMVLSENPTLTLANYIYTILKDSKFELFSLPTYSKIQNVDDANEMFETTFNLDEPNSGGSFVCMYIGGKSNTLDFGDNADYVNDGFDFGARNNYDYGKFIDRKIPQRVTDNIEKGRYNAIVFRVSFADQNQSIFTDIEIDQTEHADTFEAFQVLHDAFDVKGGTKRFYKGVDLYNVYGTRSYKVKVTMLGNVQVSPMQYFQLDNIPFFHGGYTIVKVSHEITGTNTIMTTFEGRRLPRFISPVVDTPTSYMDIPFNDILRDNIQSVLTPFNIDDIIDDSDNEILASNSYFTIQPNVVNSDIPQYPNGIETSTKILHTVRKPEGVKTLRIQENDNYQSIVSKLNQNSTNLKKYGVSGTYCSRWAQRFLNDSGMYYTINGGVGNAWDWYAHFSNFITHIDFNKNPKLSNGQIKINRLSNQELYNIGIKNGSIVWGFNINSKYINELGNFTSSMNPQTYITNTIQKNNFNQYLTPYNFEPSNVSQNKLDVLKNLTFMPITHVGIYYNGQIMSFINNTVSVNAGSWIITAHYCFLDDLKKYQ